MEDNKAMKKKFSIVIKKEDLPKHRAPVAVNQHGSVFSSKKDFNRKKEKETLRKETKKFF